MTDQPDDDPGVDRADDAAEGSQVRDGDELVAGEDVSEDESPQAAVPASTGHPAVDEVLRSLDGLDGRPVDEHVAAFEQAHEGLRDALSDAGDDTVPHGG